MQREPLRLSRVFFTCWEGHGYMGRLAQQGAAERRDRTKHLVELRMTPPGRLKRDNSYERTRIR